MARLGARKRAKLPDRAFAYVDPRGRRRLPIHDAAHVRNALARLGDRYGKLLRDVRALLKQTAQRSGGHVVETRADEFFAAFVQPAGALDTALAVQRALRARRWADRHEVRLRIGIHSGYPTLADENYLGMAVHTAARICNAAHGGQVIVSGDTRTAVGTPIPPGIRFRRLGLFGLRGIPGEVELFQLTAQGVLSRFPLPRTSK